MRAHWDIMPSPKYDIKENPQPFSNALRSIPAAGIIINVGVITFDMCFFS
jgi:hypothetical protein